MQYVSDAGAITCLSKWRPCTLEHFTQTLHNYQVTYCNEHGNDALMIKCFKLGGKAGGFVTVYYARIKCRAIGTPVLLTMSSASGKTLTFETTEELPPKGWTLDD